MKANKIMAGLIASGMAMAGLTQSCVSDAPFADGNGEGSLRLQLSVNSDLTRAERSDDELADSCIIYISNQTGLLYRFKGVESCQDPVKLKYGSYVAEAWTGDSVPASFNSRFYRAYVPFSITDDGYKTLEIPCKIANVAVKVDQSSVPADVMKEWKVTVSSSSGSLEFDAETDPDSIGYFMMPNADIARDDSGEIRKGDDGWTLYTNLRYTVEGKKVDGTDFKTTGLIGAAKYDGRLVEHAHLYELAFEYNPEYAEQGGSFIEIRVNDSEIEVHETVGLYSRPAVKGVGFDLTKQVVGEAGSFSDKIVKVAGFNTLKSVQLTSPDAEAFGLPANGVDLRKLADDKVESVKAIGLDWDYSPKPAAEPSTSYITFGKVMLDRLETRDHEYVINIHVEDGNGRETDATLRIAVGEGAVVVDDPVVFEEAGAGNLLAIRARYAVLTGSLSDEAVSPRLRYRLRGSNSEWSYVDIVPTRASSEFSVKLTNLKEGSAYEYQAECGEFVSETKYFTTETTYRIPNWDMEEWGTYKFKPYIGNEKDVVFPGLGSTPTFWSSGNAGSSMASIVLTNQSTDMHRSGTRSARLQSQAAMNMLAAGNLLAGDFVRMPSLTSAEVSFGRPYEGGGHPEALSVWVNYRPAKVSSAGQGLTTSMKDHGQIFVAFATGPSIVNTNEKKYFDPNASNILGYGEVTWEGEDYGDEGELKQLIIPIEWYEKAKTTPATHIIIVAAASKFGDYFAGGNGSTMYLDDFELVYDELAK